MMNFDAVIESTFCPQDGCATTSQDVESRLAVGGLRSASESVSGDSFLVSSPSWIICSRILRPSGSYRSSVTRSSSPFGPRRFSPPSSWSGVSLSCSSLRSLCSGWFKLAASLAAAASAKRRSRSTLARTVLTPACKRTAAGLRTSSFRRSLSSASLAGARNNRVFPNLKVPFVVDSAASFHCSGVLNKTPSPEIHSRSARCHTISLIPSRASGTVFCKSRPFL
mmetsp:Transcript_4281/g.6362  ORF Transcript_4281/g.6362 Transcript_4281/m.6362 type:complete len:224 (-) Transcript_4281:1149-1820(-)